MKQVLGLVCSQRRSGNSETFIKEVARNIPEPHELKLIRLPDFEMRPCNGCYNCLLTMECVHDDDLLAVVEAIKAADGLIVATPVYVLGAHASMRAFLDRALSFYAHGAAMWKKPVVAVGLAGMENKEGKTLLDIENFLTCIAADVKQKQIVKATLPGEVVLDPENLQIAREMGQALFGAAKSYDAIPHCPLCGGATFRFLGGDRIQCQLCSHSGTIGVKKGMPVLNLEVSDHNLFITEGAMYAHKEWLIATKMRFTENKDRLKAVREDYRSDGEWIKPPSCQILP